MSKKKQRPPSGYTPEQIKEIQNFFKNNDFTAMMSVEHKVELTGKAAEVFKRAKEIIQVRMRRRVKNRRRFSFFPGRNLRAFSLLKKILEIFFRSQEHFAIFTLFFM